MKASIMTRIAHLERQSPTRRKRCILCNAASEDEANRVYQRMLEQYPDDDLVFIRISPLIDIRDGRDR
jgi:hypothetical protein